MSPIETFRLDSRRGEAASALEGGVEVADVRRTEDDLGEHPRQRARLERDRPALAVDRGARDPAAATEQVDDDIARVRCGASIRDATSDGDGAGARRSKTGSE